MSRNLLSVVMFGVFLCLPPAEVRAELTHYPTEVTFYDPVKAYNGITLFTPRQNPWTQITYTYMIDMDGRLVHKIKSLGYSKFLENGNLLTSGDTFIEELDWSGNVVWSGPNSWISMPAALINKMQPWTAASQHHDMNKIWNKKLQAYTYMMVVRAQRTLDLAIALGARPPATDYYYGWNDDGIIEINKVGQIVWMWTFADHLCQDYDPAKPNYVTNLADAPGRLYINVTSYPAAPVHVPRSDWTHLNSVNYNDDLGLVAFNSRSMNEFFVVDHDKTFVSTTNFSANIAAAAGPNGDFIYRFGSPTNSNQGDPPGFATSGHTQIWGAHNIQWIPKTMYTGGPALPGAGNFLIFDNHCTNSNPLGGGSALVEINPRVTGPAVNGVYPAGANYVNPPLAGYVKVSNVGMASPPSNQSNQIVWKYRSGWITSFASSHISGIQRLPNGNTLGCAGEHGHFFEVTPAGELVWEYANPMGDGVPYKFQQNPGTGGMFQVFRCHRYSVNQPGLKNRVIQYENSKILPVKSTWAGTGHTLTGQLPCRNVPCKYASSS